MYFSLIEPIFVYLLHKIRNAPPNKLGNAKNFYNNRCHISMIRTAYIIMYTYTVAHTLQSLITIVVIVYTVHCHLHKEITDMYTILIYCNSASMCELETNNHSIPCVVPSVRTRALKPYICNLRLCIYIRDSIMNQVTCIIYILSLIHI